MLGTLAAQWDTKPATATGNQTKKKAIQLFVIGRWVQAARLFQLISPFPVRKTCEAERV